MRSITAALVAIALMSSAALADSVPLAAGKPAGVKQANIMSGTPLYVFTGLVFVGIAIGVAASQGRTGITSSGSPVVPPTTTTVATTTT